MNELSNLFRGINITCNALNTVRSAKTLVKQEEIPLSLRIADLSTQLFGLICDIYEVDLLMHHVPATQLMHLKEIELLDKIIAIPIRCSVETLRSTKRDGYTFDAFVAIMEKGFVASVADATRVGCELGYYDASHYLEMTPEERAKHPKIIYVNRGSADSPILEIDHIEERTEESCKRDMEDAQTGINVVSTVRLATEMKMVSTSIKSAYYALAMFLQRRAAQPTAIGGPLTIHAEAQNRWIEPIVDRVGDEDEDPLQLVDPLNLVNQRSIPDILASIDPFFQDYICPLSLSPIRDPVADPTSQNRQILYDRIWILRALRRERKSPMTRLPLNPEQLLPKPEIKVLIDTRLRIHEERIRRLISQPLESAVQPSVT